MATQLMKNKGIFLYCKAALPNLTWPYLSEQAGTKCCYGKKKKKKKRGLPSASCLLLAAQYLGWLESVTL